MSKVSANQGITFKVGFETKPERDLLLVAHIFDNSGTHLKTLPIKDGQFTLKEPLQGKQFYIAPAELPTGEKLTINNLESFDAYQPVIPPSELRKQVIELAKIPSSLVVQWFLCLCRVRGRVVKPFSFGGFTFSLPVCHARVHICRLESLLRFIPDIDLINIRDILLREPKFPFPIPEPEPFRIPIIPRPIEFNTLMSADMSTSQASLTTTAQSLSISSDLTRELYYASSPHQIRASLKNYLELPKAILPFCIKNLLYKCVEIAMVETDAQGRFDKLLFVPCAAKKDYYFWVEYLINGVWQTVYRPSFCTGAFWDYICNTNVTLTVTDSRVPIGCRPTQTTSFFEIVSIGSGALPSRIHQRTVTNPVTLAKGGVTANTGLIPMGYGGESPFGSHLVIYANTGIGFPSADSTHYRCIYKKTSDPDIDSSWTSVNNGSFFRYYNEEFDIGGGNSQVLTKGYELKDVNGLDFYKITHEDVEDDLGLPVAPVLNREWASDVYPIAVLDSTKLDDTHYDIRVEIYKKVSPSSFTLTTIAKSVFKVPDPTNPAMSQDAPDELLARVTHGGVTSFAFEMTIRVDNNSCGAAIDNALANGAAADPQCGMLSYGANKNVPLTLGFKAKHINDFATMSFSVIRGNANPIPPSNANGEVGNSPLGDYTGTNIVDPDATHNRHFVSNTLTVSQFLGTCEGAAFSQNLYVAALATDGSQRLNGYDASSVAAFALIH